MGKTAVVSHFAHLAALLKAGPVRILPPRGACVAIMVAALFPFSAHADRETQAQIQQLQSQVQDLQVRLARLEAVLQGQGLLTLYNDVQSLKDQVARLNGMSEVQGHQIDQMDRRQIDLYQNLDQRIAAQALVLEKLKTQESGTEPTPPAASTPPVANAAAPAVGPAAVPKVVNETQVYEAALARFKKGDYRGAADDFRAFQKNFPTSSLAANAQFWVGYSLYLLKDYKTSIVEMRRLLQSHPKTLKAPDALLTIASCEVELNQLTSAKTTLRELVKQYPHSTAAGIARKRLELLQ